MIVHSIDDFLLLKKHGHYRIATINGRTAITIFRPDEEPQTYFFASPGIANQARQYLTDQGMTGYVEDAS